MAKHGWGANGGPDPKETRVRLMRGEGYVSSYQDVLDVQDNAEHTACVWR